MMNQLTVLTQEIVVITASRQILFTLFKWLKVISQAFVINLESFFSWFEQPASNHFLLQLHFTCIAIIIIILLILLIIIIIIINILTTRIYSKFSLHFNSASTFVDAFYLHSIPPPVPSLV
jgi:hypothetical protein